MLSESSLSPDYCYSVKELAFIWNMSPEWVRRICLTEPGVMLFRHQVPGKRVYRSIRVPGVVALRISERFKVA